MTDWEERAQFARISDHPRDTGHGRESARIELGVVLPFSLGTARQRGADTRTLVLKVVRRTLLLFALALLVGWTLWRLHALGHAWAQQRAWQQSTPWQLDAADLALTTAPPWLPVAVRRCPCAR